MVQEDLAKIPHERYKSHFLFSILVVDFDQLQNKKTNIGLVEGKDPHNGFIYSISGRLYHKHTSQPSKGKVRDHD